MDNDLSEIMEDGMRRIRRAAHDDPKVMRVLIDNMQYISSMEMLGVSRERAIALRETMTEKDALSRATMGTLEDQPAK